MGQIRQTHTYAVLEVSKSTFEEIYNKLKAAEYHHAFDTQNGKVTINMHGIGLVQEENKVIKVIKINGREFNFSKSILSYYDICKCVNLNPDYNPTIVAMIDGQGYFVVKDTLLDTTYAKNVIITAVNTNLA